MSVNENKGAIGCAVYDVDPATMCSARLSVEKKDGIRRTMSANENRGAIGCAVYDVVPATMCSARLSVESVAR